MIKVQTFSHDVNVTEPADTRVVEIIDCSIGLEDFPRIEEELRGIEFSEVGKWWIVEMERTHDEDDPNYFGFAVTQVTLDPLLNFDSKIAEHLRASGDLWPQTSEEISNAIDSLEVTEELPEKFNDPFAIIDKPKELDQYLKPFKHHSMD